MKAKFMITEPAKEDIRKELKAEYFPLELIEDTLQLIVLEIEAYRENLEYSIGSNRGGVVERLIEEYSADKYQQLQPIPELILHEAEQTRQKHSHGNFSSMGRDGLD